jgi:hypothetical protein
MSTTRRILVLVTLIAAVFVGSGAAAQASFSESVAVTASPMRITTASVAAPVRGSGSLVCGTTAATMGLTWTKSTSPRVIGYRVNVQFSDGYVQTVDKAATDTAWSQGILVYNVTAYAVRYSVTTLTDYGWTAESTKTSWFQC